MSDTQEGWADSLYYYRSSKNIELLGNAQVTDTTRDVSALAGRIFYTDSLSEVKLTRDPAVIGVMKNAEDQPDTVYFGADTIFARTYMMFQVNESEIKNSKSRLEDLAVDAVQAYRQKAAKEAAEAAAKAMENDPNRPKPNKKQTEETGTVAAAGGLRRLRGRLVLPSPRLPRVKHLSLRIFRRRMRLLRVTHLSLRMLRRWMRLLSRMRLPERIVMRRLMQQRRPRALRQTH